LNLTAALASSSARGGGGLGSLWFPCNGNICTEAASCWPSGASGGFLSPIKSSCHHYCSFPLWKTLPIYLVHHLISRSSPKSPDLQISCQWVPASDSQELWIMCQRGKQETNHRGAY
jgi:hypothetical protein